MEKKNNVGGKQVVFKATATPLKYRTAFPGKDLFKDLMGMERHVKAWIMWTWGYSRELLIS